MNWNKIIMATMKTPSCTTGMKPDYLQLFRQTVAIICFLTYGNEKINKEGEESPAEEEDHHHSQNYNVSHQPGQQELLLLQHDPQQEEKAGKKMGG
jgi:uncharacterized ion transporter superfamily protein YfcC